MPVVLTGAPNAARGQVRVDFTHDPSSSSYTWVDITNRARSASYRRGRSYERDIIEAATGTLKLRNDDGALDPTNGASTYAPNVIPFRRIQHNVTVLGVTYPVFTGLVERWPQEWDTGYGYSPVQVVDMFAWFGASKLRSAYEYEVLADGVAAFYPLDDPAGSTSASEASGGTPGTIAVGCYGAGSLTFGGSTTVVGAGGAVSMSSPDAGTAAATSGPVGVASGRATWLTATHPLAGQSAFTAEMWFQGPSSAPAAADETLFTLIGAARSGGQVTWLALETTTGKAYAFNTAFGTIRTAASVCDGKWHHLSADVNYATGAMHLYLDGALAASASVAPSGTTVPAGVWDLGVAARSSTGTGVVNDVGYMFSGSLAMFALYPTALSSTRVTAHYTAGATAFVGETADARILRILGYAGWTGATAIDACTTQMLGATDIKGQSALAAIQAVASTEGGSFFISANGTVTYKSRHARMTTTTPSYVFGEGVGEMHYESIAFDFDPTYVYNDIALTRATGAPASATDATSKARYGVRTLAQTTQMLSDSEIVNAATWLLASYKDPHLRVSSITLNPASDFTLYPACLGIEIGTRVTVKRRPPGGPTISADFFVEQISPAIAPDSFKVQLSLSPIPLKALVADDAATVCDSIYVAAY